MKHNWRQLAVIVEPLSTQILKEMEMLTKKTYKNRNRSSNINEKKNSNRFSIESYSHLHIIYFNKYLGMPFNLGTKPIFRFSFFLGELAMNKWNFESILQSNWIVNIQWKIGTALRSKHIKSFNWMLDHVDQLST